jgi:transposase
MKTNSDTPPALYLGLDVHKEQTVAAIADPSPRGEVRSGGAFKTCQPALEKFLRKLAKSHGIPLSRLCVCYEAGGCGFWMARRLRQLGVPCLVVAPSLIPTRIGDRVKTDKKDAVKLARLLRAGELTPVHLPDEVDETIRDLCRARTDAIDDLRRSKTRLLGFLRRNGYHYQGKTHWTEAHKRYLRELRLPYAAQVIVFEDYLQSIDELLERVTRLEKSMEDMLEEWERKPLVEALMALKGFQRVAAMVTVSEIGSFTRFEHPKRLMSYLGLVPGEHSSGSRQVRSGITKCGNPHCRWLLVECSVHYKPEPKVSAQLSRRQEGQPRWVKELSWRTQLRLHRRYRVLRGRGMHYNKIKTALARELCAFLWELGTRIEAGEPTALAR